MKNIKLTLGTLEPNEDMSSWIVTSEIAAYKVSDEYGRTLTIYMQKNDRIDINGDVISDGEHLANIANI